MPDIKNDKDRDNSLNEVRILASIKNNINIIKYYEAFFEKDKESQVVYLCIVMEYATDGDLF